VSELRSAKVGEIREETAAVGQRDRIVKAEFASRAICDAIARAWLLGPARAAARSHPTERDFP